MLTNKGMTMFLIGGADSTASKKVLCGTDQIPASYTKGNVAKLYVRLNQAYAISTRFYVMQNFSALNFTLTESTQEEFNSGTSFDVVSMTAPE